MIRTIVSYLYWPVVVATSLGAFGFAVTAGVDPGLAIFLVSAGNMIFIGLSGQVIPLRKEWNLFRDWQTPNDIIHAILASEGGGRLAKFILNASFAILAARLSGMAGTVLWPEHWPLLFQAAFALLILEVAFYWVHRLFHRAPFWRLHNLHHNSRTMHVVKGGRLHIGEILIRHVLIFAPLVLLGVPDLIIFWLTIWMNTLGNLGHANLKLNFPGFVHGLLTTPAVHHLHHSTDADLGNSNFSNTLVFMDRLFGTFRHPNRYALEKVGVEGESGRGNPLRQLIAPFRRQSRVEGTPASDSKPPEVGLSVALVLIFALASCQGFDRIDYSQGFSRASWQQPDRVIQELNLPPNAIVADLGAGSGYFAQRFARTLPEAKIYAVEVTPELTQKLAALRVTENLNNMHVISGAFADPKLPERVDLIFLVNTYHHIENQSAYFALIREKYLKPGGRVATIDHRHDMSGIMRLFLSAGHWSDPAVVREQMRAAGFQESAAPDFLANQNFQIFAPAETPAPQS